MATAPQQLLGPDGKRHYAVTRGITAAVPVSVASWIDWNATIAAERRRSTVAEFLSR